MPIPPLAGRIRAQEVAAAPARLLRAALTQVGRLVLAAAGPGPATAPAPAPAAPVAAVPVAAVPVEAAELPVPRYDELSLPSLRARLRGLDAGQVAMLAAYERAHAGRPDVVAMFERRIARLAGE
jgi:hypothetical protein